MRTRMMLVAATLALSALALVPLGGCKSTDMIPAAVVFNDVNAITATSDLLLKGEMILAADKIKPNAVVMTETERTAALDTNETTRRMLAEALKPPGTQ